MAILYCLLTENGDSGTYWASLPTTGTSGNWKERYGNAIDGYRVYDHWSAWKADMSDNYLNWNDSCVLEIQGKWDDTSSYTYKMGYFLGFYSWTITTKINGVRDPDSYHYGVYGGGWRLYQNGEQYPIRTSQSNVHLDGIEVYNYRGTSYAVYLNNYSCSVQNCILYGTLRGIYINGAVCQITSNIVHGASAEGIYVSANADGSEIHYNTVVDNAGKGIKLDTYHVGRTFYNLSYNNGTNWDSPASPQPTFFAGYNAGESGDSPADTEGSTAITLTDTDFTDSTNSTVYSRDYSPASSTSSLVDVHEGIQDGIFPPINESTTVGRPSYNLQDPDLVDCGAFEFDHGNGLAPLTVTLSITGMAEGSSLAVYNSSTDAEILAPTAIDSSGNYTDTAFAYTADIPVKVVVRKGTSGTKYLPYSQLGTINENGLSMIVSQVVDTIA